MSLKPHHVLGVKPPRLFFQRFRSQILSLCSFHVVEDKEKRLRGQPLKELDRVRPLRRQLGVVGRRVARVSRQVGSQPL